MNRVRLVSILGACALTFSVIGPALAEDAAPAKSAGADEPSVKDIGKSNRGIFFKSPGADMPFQIQKPGQPVQSGKTTAKTVEAITPVKPSPKTSSPFKVKLRTPVAKTDNKSRTGSGKGETAKGETTGGAATKGQAKANTAKDKPEKIAAHKSPAKAPAKASASVTPAGKPAVTTGSVSASDQSGTVLKAWLNRTGKAPHYKDGDKMEINVSTSKDCSLVIYDFDGKGTLTQIFPNDYQKEGSVRAGETVTIGGEASSFDFQVSLADGSTSQQERLFIFAYPANSKDEAPVSVAMAKVPSSPFRSGPMTTEQYRKLVKESKVFFNPRSVVVKAKPHTIPVGSNPDIQTVSNELNDGNTAPNKMELSFVVEK